MLYVYTDNSPKNRAGGLGQLCASNKVVPVFSMPDAGCRCHVHILDMYFSKLPPGAFDRDNIYLTPLPVAPKDPGKPWFFVSLVGRNTLSKIVKEICQEIKIPSNKTNHSLRATGASELFQAGVPEKVTAQNWSPVASGSAPV